MDGGRGCGQLTCSALPPTNSPRTSEGKQKVKVAQLCLCLCNPMDMEFSRPKYWSGQLFPSLGDLPNPGIKPRSPALQANSLPVEPQGKPVGNQVMGNKKGCVMFLFWLCLASFLYLGNIFVFFFFEPKRGCRRRSAGTGQSRRHPQRRWKGGSPLGRRKTRRSSLSQSQRSMRMPILPKLLKGQ